MAMTGTEKELRKLARDWSKDSDKAEKAKDYTAAMVYEECSNMLLATINNKEFCADGAGPD